MKVITRARNIQDYIDEAVDALERRINGLRIDEKHALADVEEDVLRRAQRLQTASRLANKDSPAHGPTMIELDDADMVILAGQS